MLGISKTASILCLYTSHCHLKSLIHTIALIFRQHPIRKVSLFNLHFPFLLLFFYYFKEKLSVHRMSGKVFLRELYFAGKQYLSTLSINDILFVKLNILHAFDEMFTLYLKKGKFVPFYLT